MKHLFLIHSHTMFLTSMGVIEKLGLHQADVVIMNFRNYHNPQFPIKYASYDYSEVVENSYHIFFSYSRKHFGIDKKMRSEIVTAFDSFVDDIIQGEYMLYVPQLQSPTFQILATNGKCKEVFFVQEGGRIMWEYTTNRNKWYFSLYNKLFMRHENRMWKAFNWFPEENAPYNKPIVAYAFDKAYFGDAPSKVIMVKWPKLKVDVTINPQFPIFVLEGAVELGQIEKDVYMNSVDKLISDCGKRLNYIKFHPQQTQETQKEFLNMFRAKGLNIETLPMDVPFELILTSYENLTVCGFGSSLLFYAKALGHKVISHESDLMVSPRYRMYSKNIQKLS